MTICIYHRWWETASGFSKYRRCTYCVYDCWLRCKLLCNWPSIVGITKIGGRREILWILIFMIPLVFASQWFMIPTRIQIYDSRRLLISYWLNDFLRGNLVSFSILWCSNFCFIQTWYHHSFCLGTKRKLIGETSGLSAPNAWIIYGVPGHVPPEKSFENWTLGNAISCIPRNERN